MTAALLSNEVDGRGYAQLHDRCLRESRLFIPDNMEQGGQYLRSDGGEPLANASLDGREATWSRGECAFLWMPLALARPLFALNVALIDNVCNFARSRLCQCRSPHAAFRGIICFGSRTASSCFVCSRVSCRLSFGVWSCLLLVMGARSLGV